MSFGAKRFETVEDGRKFRLSDGTEITFLGRDPDGVNGVSVEELMAVLTARLNYMRRDNERGRYISLAITDVQSAENWLNRWQNSVQVEQQLREQAKA